MHQRQRAIFQIREHPVGHRVVVGGEIELGGIRGGKEQTVGVRDGDAGDDRFVELDGGHCRSISMVPSLVVKTAMSMPEKA